MNGPLNAGAWWGLGRGEQVTLRWLVEHGGQARASDSIALAGFKADGLAVVNGDGQWTATDAGRALFASRDGNPGGSEQLRRTTSRAFENAALSTRGVA